MIGNADKAAQWLRTPNRALAGEVPIDQLDTDLGVKKWKTFSGVSPTASIADASLEDLQESPCCRCLLW